MLSSLGKGILVDVTGINHRRLVGRIDEGGR